MMTNYDPDGENVEMMEDSIGDLASARSALSHISTGAGAEEAMQTSTYTGAGTWSNTNIERALYYGRTHLSRYLSQLPEIQALMTFILFLPVVSISAGESAAPAIRADEIVDFLPTPYRKFVDPARYHTQFLAPLFKQEFCVRNGIPRDAPLRVAVDLGAGGALHKILKVRAVMKETRTDWSQADELPVEIPLPTQFRFHSIFCCPVSKEQGTDENPPMMMACGHVVCKESLARLGKGAGDYRKVKCPYCPIESTVGQAKRVYF